MKVFAISDLHGETGLLESFKAKVYEEDPGAVVFTGDIVRDGARYNEYMNAIAGGRTPRRDIKEIVEEEHEDILAYEAFFKTLNEMGKRCFVIPGNMDAPLDLFLQQAINRETIARNVHIIHNRITTKFLSGQGREIYMCGFGGDIVHKDTDDFFTLRFSRAQAFYAADTFRDFPNPRALLLHTPPKNLTPQGSDIVDEMIDNCRPSHVFCGRAGDFQGDGFAGTAFVVCPGSMQDGDYAIMETITNRVEYRKLEVGAGVQRM